MGRVEEAAGDNAAMENFFSLLLLGPLQVTTPMLQKNVLNRRVWPTRQDLRIAIVGHVRGSDV